MKKIILLFIVIIFSFNVFSQPAIQWKKCFGGTNFDIAEGVIQTSDGGYAVVGLASSTDGDVSGNHGGTDC